MKSKFYVLSLAFSFLLVTGCSSKETRSVNVTKQDTKIDMSTLFWTYFYRTNNL